MAEALKNVYNKYFFENILDSFEKIAPKIDRKVFLVEIFTTKWENLELKARTSQAAIALKYILPTDFKLAASLLIQLTEQLQKDGIKGSYEHLFIPEYIERNGLNERVVALDCIEKITQFVSCEFAIRPFIEMEPRLVMQQLQDWSKHPNEHVRRLASEGCRPRLPWASALVKFKKDPSPILPILENLKADSSLYVRNSVANNLNDISKDHPQLFLQLAKRWMGKNTNTNWIIKHASRTLLKAGNQKALALFGYAEAKQLNLSNFKIKQTKLQLGESLQFDFELENSANTELKVRLEYGLFFKKKNGSNNCKVFKLSEKTLSAGEKIEVQKHHVIKAISTRVYYDGEQFLSLIVNGIPSPLLKFELIV